MPVVCRSAGATPASAAAAIAAVTKNIRIRAGSCVSPLHHPVRIAEEWGLVDNLSNGRVDISFAAGWIDAAQLRRNAEPMAKNPYGQYLLRLAGEGPQA